MNGQDHTFEIDDPEGEALGENTDPPYPATGEQLPEIAAPSVQRRDVLPEHADDAAAIDAFLSGYGRGFQVSIVRTAPVWCAGYLTTLPMDHGITLNEIRESFGGRRFQLRILTDQGRYVAMRTVLIADVPRDDGRPLASLDRGSPDTPKANPAPAAAAASGFGELAGVLRDLLQSQQAASARQSEMLERLIMNPVQQAQAAIASPLQQIQQLGEVIAAVRELTPAIAAGGAEGVGANGETIMMSLAEKLISKWGSGGEKKAAPAQQLPPGRAPGARRAPIIIQGPRPAGIPAPRPAPAPIVPNPTPIAAAAVPLDTSPELRSVPPTVDDSASVLEQADDDDGDDEYSAEDVRALLAGMPVDDAAEVIRDVFDGLNDEDKQRAIAILVAEPAPELAESEAEEVDNSSTVDP